jgi:protein tyrosine phosphatase (PTP) superfamily phosphohydrolase (DUF442 family)
MAHRPHRPRVAALLLAAWALSACAYLPGNVRTVEAGRLYRCGQAPPEVVARAIDERGIRTVVNLRGADPDADWWREERAAVEAAGGAHIDLDWTKDALPPPDSLATLVALYEEARAPMLIHCQGGTHRTGVAAAVWVLMRGGTPDDARRQFGPFFGGAPIGGLVDAYEAAGYPAQPFAEWVRASYPGVYAAHPDAQR